MATCSPIWRNPGRSPRTADLHVPPLRQHQVARRHAVHRRGRRLEPVERQQEYNGPASGLLEAVESIEATDRITAVFQLKYAYPPLLRGLTYFNSSTIVPKHIFDNGDGPAAESGEPQARSAPARSCSRSTCSGSHIMLEKNPNFHLQGQPYLDRLVFQIIPNEAARALALEKGEIDYMPYYAMSLSDVERLQSNPEGDDHHRHAADRRRVHGASSTRATSRSTRRRSGRRSITRSTARSCCRRPASASARSRPGRSPRSRRSSTPRGAAICL